MTRKNRGFTLVEIIIALAVVGILAAIGFVVYNHMADKASDAKKITEVNMMKQQLDLYLVKYETLPFGSGDTSMIDLSQYHWDAPEPTLLFCDNLIRNFLDRLDNFSGCTAYERGNVFIGSRKWQTTPNPNGHPPSLTIASRFGSVRMSHRNNEKDMKSWKSLFRKIPNIANVTPPADEAGYTIDL